MRPATPDYIEQSLSIIRNTENSLLSLVSQAAESRDYDAMAKMMASAKAIGEIARSSSGEQNEKKLSMQSSITRQTILSFFVVTTTS